MSSGHYETYPGRSSCLPAGAAPPRDLILPVARRRTISPMRRSRAARASRAPRAARTAPARSRPFPERLFRLAVSPGLTAPLAVLRPVDGSRDVAKQRYASFGRADGLLRRPDPSGAKCYKYGGKRRPATSPAGRVCSGAAAHQLLGRIVNRFPPQPHLLRRTTWRGSASAKTRSPRAERLGGWWDLMRFQIERARSMMLAGARRDPLGAAAWGWKSAPWSRRSRTPGELERVQGDVFRHRPV